MIAFIPIPSPVFIPTGNGCGKGGPLELIIVLIAAYFIVPFIMGITDREFKDKIDWGAPIVYLFFPYILGYGFAWFLLGDWRKRK